MYFIRVAEINVEQNEVFTCLTAARQVIERDGLRPMFLVDPAAMEDFSGLETENPNCVVVGLAPSLLDHEHLNKAFRCSHLNTLRIHNILCKEMKSMIRKFLISLQFLTVKLCMNYSSLWKCLIIVNSFAMVFHTYLQIMQP